MKAKKRVIKTVRPIVTQSFTVFGKPQPQGSTRAFTNHGRIVITSTNKKLKPWRQQLTETIFSEAGVYTGDGSETVTMSLTFYFEKPKSVKREYMTVKPDIDKLIRAILDSGTGVLYKDDSQVNVVSAVKTYGSPERVEISIIRI